MDAQRLEGSRFGAYPATLATFGLSLVRPKRVKTSGSPPGGGQRQRADRPPAGTSLASFLLDIDGDDSAWQIA
jgi:hypothetical protein